MTNLSLACVGLDPIRLRVVAPGVPERIESAPIDESTLACRRRERNVLSK